ncbi:MAG: quinol:cytochrome C oxidoreductase [Pedobacter sp.]|nr:MAG: quinol:cytochrome C oxidoreductase [Pedobacter sp.]
MATKDVFAVPNRYRTWSLALIGVGVLSVIVGFFLYGNGDVHHKTRFWATLLHNSVYFLLICNASMFFICATTLAWGGWQMAFRRIPEAISAAVPVIGVIALVILLAIAFGGHHMTHIYHWTDEEAVAGDKILKGKSGFLNLKFFTIWTVLTIGLWSILGYKMRKLSLEVDNNPLPDIEAGRKYVWKNTVWAAIFIVWFSLTVLSVTPWLWIMSIDAHWYSTMYSWYSFASTFVAGMSLIALYIIYLKNKGYLEYVNDEHLHDVGKFMFAFSIFWTYLWFSQYMLIWYANIPEETVYFKARTKDGAYSGIFWFMLIINFLAPLLLLMKRGAKRNYTNMAILAVVIIFGHWLDFYQMIFASVAKEHVELGLFDFGVAAGFVGTIMLVAGKALSKNALVSNNHPFVKESIIHHT